MYKNSVRVILSLWYTGWRQNPLLSDHLELANRFPFPDLRFLAWERLSMELKGMVSLMSVTSSSPTSAMSGQVEVTQILGYHLPAHREDLHTMLRYSLMPLTKAIGPQSYHQVCLPCCNISERMW